MKVIVYPNDIKRFVDGTPVVSMEIRYTGSNGDTYSYIQEYYENGKIKKHIDNTHGEITSFDEDGKRTTNNV